MSTQLCYQRAGSGHPLVLIHGYLAGSEIWRDQIVQFAADHDIIAPDLPGFAESAALEAKDRIEAHAQVVLDLLNSLGVERFDLLGHSMGGMVVQQIAAIAGDRLSSLILYGTGPVGLMPGRFETIEESRQKLRANGLEATAEGIAASWFRAGRDAAGYPLCLELGRQASLQAALASLSAWEHWDGRANLTAIRAPTLVLWGDRDRSYPWSQPEALWRGIRDSSLAVVPGCAHMVHLEKPDLFNRLIADFVSGR